MADKLGTIEVGTYTSHGLINMTEENDEISPAVSVRCSFGRIVASVGRADCDYNDMYIDLITDDGRELQLAVVSCAESGASWDGDPYITVLAYNGKNDGPTVDQEVHVGDDSYWYEH